MNNAKLEVDIAVLTVLSEEYKAFYTRLNNVRPVPIDPSAPNLYAWVIGELPSSSGTESYKVVLGMIGQAGTNPSALATKETVNRWNPRYILFVGIAGGFEREDLKKGDVVISKLICGYDYGKLEKEYEPRSDRVYRPNRGLLNNALAHASLDSSWIAAITMSSPDNSFPKVIEGEIASGDKVVDDPTNEFFVSILRKWPKLQAVEMEGAGAAAAIEEAEDLGILVGFLMIRGISDMPRTAGGSESRGTEERDTWKEYAAETAAAFTVSFITNRFPVPPEQPFSEEDESILIHERLSSLAIEDEEDDSFGVSQFTANLALHYDWIEPASNFVILAALPLRDLGVSSSTVIEKAKAMLDPNEWNQHPGEPHPPRYWPHSILKIPTKRRSSKGVLFWEEKIGPAHDLVLSRLAITTAGEVIYASAYEFVYKIISGEKTPVFRIGPILASCWKLSGLVAQLYTEVGYRGRTHLCIAMVNTNTSHLGDFADGGIEPSTEIYWQYARHQNWSCHSKNLRYCQTTNLLEMQPKIQPDFVRQFAEEISLAYNQDSRRCLEPDTGLVPVRYLRTDASF